MEALAFSEERADKYIGSGIEEVITGRTRNAFVLQGTWVRIPPTPL